MSSPDTVNDLYEHIKESGVKDLYEHIIKFGTVAPKIGLEPNLKLLDNAELLRIWNSNSGFRWKMPNPEPVPTVKIISADEILEGYKKA